MHIYQYEPKNGGRTESVGGAIKWYFGALFIQASSPRVYIVPAFFRLPLILYPGTILAVPGPGSSLGALAVITLKIYDSHKKPETARARAPRGAAVLEKSVWKSW